MADNDVRIVFGGDPDDLVQGFLHAMHSGRIRLRPASPQAPRRSAMSDLILSYVRTYVPVAVGASVSWVAVHWGIVVPKDLEAQAAIVLTGAAVLVYYTLVRALEKRWPAFGKLLGSAKKPVYVEPR